MLDIKVDKNVEQITDVTTTITIDKKGFIDLLKKAEIFSWEHDTIRIHDSNGEELFFENDKLIVTCNKQTSETIESE